MTSRSSHGCRPASAGPVAVILLALAGVAGVPAARQVPTPATETVPRRIIALAEPGQTIHQPFADAALRWLHQVAAREGFVLAA
jgi:hypothetical protein